MKQVNIHEAKTHLSALIDKAANGEEFIIAKAGKPMVRVVPYAEPPAMPRTGFMEGQFTIPDDFDNMDSTAIDEMFGGGQ